MRIVVYTDNDILKKRICDYIENYTSDDFFAVDDDPVRAVEDLYADVLIISAGCFTPQLKEAACRSLNGIVLYLAGSSEKDALCAYQYRFDGFILESNLEADMDWCIENACYLIDRKINVYAVTFGSFSLFINRRLVEFSNGKAKELIALCVDKCGQRVKIEEATDKLWGGRSYDKRVKGLYRKAIMDVKVTLKNYEMESIFKSGRGYCSIDASVVRSDYYSFMSNPSKYYYLFGGKYMQDYSWGEATLARLYDIYTAKKKNDFL